jgi:uncharacterized metal-binding protein
MPSGERHLKLEMMLFPFIVGIYFVMDAVWQRAVAFGVAYLAASFLLSPDLDLHKNDARRRWGFLGFIWMPYSKIFKHRGLSHNLFFGMITRIGYLGLIIAGIVAGLYYAGVNIPAVAWTPDWHMIGVIVAGLYLPNILHVLYDHWDTSRKMRRTRRMQRAR